MGAEVEVVPRPPVCGPSFGGEWGGYFVSRDSTRMPTTTSTSAMQYHSSAVIFVWRAISGL